MKYFKSVADSNGFIYSIDNCILQYTLKAKLFEDILINKCRKLKEKYELNNEYWERLNCSPCSHWSWFCNHIHLCNGIYLSIGQFNPLNDKDKNMICPVVKLEINLNKHSDKECFKELNKELIDNSGEIHLIKYDLAVDIPTTPDRVEVFGSNKERGLYKGTRYFGQRNKNGYCKIYDKQKESELDEPLTRVEHTISLTKTTKNLSLEKVYVRSGEIADVKLNDTDKCIVAMINSLRAFGDDTSRYIDMLGRVKKEKLLNILSNSQYKKLEYDENIIKELLKAIQDLTQYMERKSAVFPDKNGFLRCDDYDLPFD